MPNMHPLITLYGNEALVLTINIIKELAANSNIPFDKKYIDLGISFLIIKANEILDGSRSKPNLKDLVISSFGEAAMYKYNFNGGKL